MINQLLYFDLVDKIANAIITRLNNFPQCNYYQNEVDIVDPQVFQNCKSSSVALEKVE